MWYLIYSYNYLTLCKSIRYIDEVYGRDKSILIYSEFNSPIPEPLFKCYNIKVLHNNHKYFQNRLLRSVYQLFRVRYIKNSVLSIFSKEIDTLGNNCEIIVFRDTYNPEASILKKIKLLYPSIKITLIEEGAGLYCSPAVLHTNSFFKNIVYNLFGLSTLELKNERQGSSKYIDKVICTQPKLLKERYCSTNVVLEKQIDVFTYEFCVFFSSLFKSKNKNEILECDFPYVFLTSPMQEIVLTEKDIERYFVFLKRVVEIVTNKGKLLIKCHPRDKFNYKFLESENVKICNQEENIIPFECLYEFYGKPQILTLFSSSCITLKGKRFNLLLFKLFDGLNVTEKSLEPLLQCGNNFLCNSYDDIKAQI